MQTKITIIAKRFFARFATKDAYGSIPPYGTVQPFPFQSLHGNIRQFIEPRYIVHFGNILAVCAMLSSEMLHLRLFMIGASICGISFNLLQLPPLITPAGWGCFFIMGHTVQIYYLLRDKLEIKMSNDLNSVYETSFFRYGFTPRQFIDLCNYTNYKFKYYKPGTDITTEGTDMPYLSHLIQGKVSVLHPEQGALGIIDSNVNDGVWLGEFYDPNRNFDEYWSEPQHKWHVTHRCVEECQVMQFDRKKLDEFLNRNDSLSGKANRIVVKDVWGKLRNTNRIVVLRSYQDMLKMALVDGTLSKSSKQLLQEYATEHNIDKQHVVQSLNDLGWTYEQFEEIHCTKNINNTVKQF